MIWKFSNILSKLIVLLILPNTDAFNSDFLKFSFKLKFSYLKSSFFTRTPFWLVLLTFFPLWFLLFFLILKTWFEIVKTSSWPKILKLNFILCINSINRLCSFVKTIIKVFGLVYNYYHCHYDFAIECSCFVVKMILFN